MALALFLSVAILTTPLVFWAVSRPQEQAPIAPYYILVGESTHKPRLRDQLRRMVERGGEDTRIAAEAALVFGPNRTAHEWAMVLDTANTHEEANERLQKLAELGFENLQIVSEEDRFFLLTPPERGLRPSSTE
jgi:hypothetical protein